ncbi:MAG: hybrid sensor histidine kinase/response regulator, partial [Ideonella sp.]|nr:hybrid sensor histidine kinase/response regulator [Ideonella sp.]
MQLTDTGPADPRAPRGRRSLLWASGALILAALGLVVWTEVRQFQLISSATQRQDDYAQVSLGYLESEYLRLRLAWADAISAPRPDREALQLRYDIFVSRVDLLDTERSRLILRADEGNELAYRRIRRFIAEADAVLGPRAPALEASELRRLMPALVAIDQPVHAMVIDGSHHLSHVITQRTTAMRETNHITLLLTVLLTTAAFGFALLSLAQYRRLDLRRRSLEAVTEDLRQAQRVAEDASAAKTNFLANMSHEIRTPLQGVLGMMALLADSPLSPDQQRRL